MFRSLAAAALAMCLGAAGCVHGRGTPQEPFVDDVVFRGVKAVDSDDLADVLATRGPVARGGVSDGLVKDRQRFDPDALATDVKRIQAFYRDRGYYAVTVEDPGVEGVEPGLVRVVFRVEEGSPARVTKLDVEGLDAAPEAQKKLGKLPLRVGDVFKVSAYDAARDAIVAALRNNGWATGDVTQNAVVLPDVDIGRGARLKNVIVDRGVRIPDGLVVGEDPDVDAARFRRTEAGISLITKAMIDRLDG